MTTTRIRRTFFTASALALALLAPAAKAFQRDHLDIWISPDKGHAAIARIGQRFEQATGIKVEVQAPDDLASRFDRLASTAKGPDIVIFAHDRFGSWINDGLLEPLQPSEAALERAPGFAWEAVTVGSARYGYPLATEAVSLIYNRDLIDAPPRSLADVAEIDQRLRAQGKRAIGWDYRNLYFSWPIIAGNGGYSLGKHDGIYDLTDSGLATPGAEAGVAQIKQLLDSGVLDRDMDYNRAVDAFKRGELAMIINGPWAWNELRQAGLRFALADIPTADPARPGKPFVGVLAAAVNSASPNKLAAQQFIEQYLTTADGLAEINAEKPLGAVANLELMKRLQSDPSIAHLYASAQHGEIMPDIPEMKRFWALTTPRLAQMLSGEKPIGPTLAYIGERLARGAEMQAWRRRHYPSATPSPEPTVP